MCSKRIGQALAVIEEMAGMHQNTEGEISEAKADAFETCAAILRLAIIRDDFDGGNEAPERH